jgi:hypothetical protein
VYQKKTNAILQLQEELKEAKLQLQKSIDLNAQQIKAAHTLQTTTQKTSDATVAALEEQHNLLIAKSIEKQHNLDHGLYAMKEKETELKLLQQEHSLLQQQNLLQKQTFETELKDSVAASVATITHKLTKQFTEENKKAMQQLQQQQMLRIEKIYLRNNKKMEQRSIDEETRAIKISEKNERMVKKINTLKTRSKQIKKLEKEKTTQNHRKNEQLTEELEDLKAQLASMKRLLENEKNNVREEQRENKEQQMAYAADRRVLKEEMKIQHMKDVADILVLKEEMKEERTHLQNQLKKEHNKHKEEIVLTEEIRQVREQKEQQKKQQTEQQKEPKKKHPPINQLVTKKISSKITKTGEKVTAVIKTKLKQKKKIAVETLVPSEKRSLMVEKKSSLVSAHVPLPGMKRTLSEHGRLVGRKIAPSLPRGAQIANKLTDKRARELNANMMPIQQQGPLHQRPLHQRPLHQKQSSQQQPHQQQPHQQQPNQQQQQSNWFWKQPATSTPISELLSSLDDSLTPRKGGRGALFDFDGAEKKNAGNNEII